MNPRVVEVADAIAKDTVSESDFKFLKAYIFSCNKFKTGNSDDVFANFLLDIKENYNPSFEHMQKEAWLYAHIKRAISDIARFDTYGLLNNPVPVIVDMDGHYIPISKEHGPEEVYEINEGYKVIEAMKMIMKDKFEEDIYIRCIVGNTPASYVAAEWGKSHERGRVTKDKILEKLKLYIENFR